MKLFAITLVVLVVHDAYGKKHDNEVQKMLAEFMEDKSFDLSVFNDMLEMGDKIKKNCPDLNVKLNETMREVEKCTEEIKIGPNTICTILKINIIPCIKPIREHMASCLPAESKDLPLVLEKIFSTIITQVCSSTLEETLEFFNPCQFRKNSMEFASCKDIRPVLNSFKNKIPTKEFVCSLLQKFKTCTKDILDASCSNTITKTVYTKLYQALEENTKDVCNNPSKNKMN